MNQVMETKNKTTKLKAEFFDFYDELELVREVPGDEFKILHDMNRGLIIYVLRVGIEDMHPITGKKVIRRALSAGEILDNVNAMKLKKLGMSLTEYEKSNEYIKKGNLFFHLNKLLPPPPPEDQVDYEEKENFVKIVGEIKSGRRSTSYYGRTSKIFLYQPKDEKPHYDILQSDALIGLLKKLNPNKTKKQIKKKIEVIDRINNEGKYFMEWLKIHEDDFKGLDIDFIQLMQLSSLIYRFTPDVAKGLEDMADLLKFDKEKFYKCCDED